MGFGNLKLLSGFSKGFFTFSPEIFPYQSPGKPRFVGSIYNQEITALCFLLIVFVFVQS
jgi:hypothetical protein